MPKLSVLYIDDDETNRDIVKRILSRAPYEVELSEATNGNEGVAMAAEKHPQLILMDFHMPGLAGPDATKQIRANEKLADVKIVALTADIYSRSNFEEAGCNSYLTKPIRKNALLHAIGELFPDLPKE